MNLSAIFSPKSIAVIGASTKIGSVGNDVIKNLATQGFTGKIYPINPKAESLYDLPCYPNLSAVADDIDLAVVIVPAIAVPEVMREAAQKKVKGAIIISAGFKEAGQAELEEEVKKICQESDIALIGPNCLGVINTQNSMSASFASFMPPSGAVTFISQSGALGTAILDYCKKLNLGVAKFVSVGNKAVVGEVELLNYFAADEQTKIIALYVEQLKQPQEIIAAVKKLQNQKNAKPVILIKSGRTAAGASASASHTGAIAGNEAAYDALFAQSGIIRAQKVSELFEYVQAFNCNQLPTGRNVAIITNAGGPGVLTTDEAVSNGLQLAKLSSTTLESLKKVLPAAANIHNPIDVLGDAKADRYQAALQAAVADPGVDSLLIVLTPQSTTEVEATAQAIIETKKNTAKPIIACFMGEEMVQPGIDLLMLNGVACTKFPEPAAKALSVITEFAQKINQTEDVELSFKDVDKKRVQEIFTEAKKVGKNSFPESSALEILAAYNFPLLKSQVAANAEEAAEIAAKINGPMAFKIVSPDILHKSDVGGIMLNVLPKQAAEKFQELLKIVATKKPEAKLEGVLMVEMASAGGLELILGSTSDPSLGQMIMVGLGGIYVEVFKDVAFGLAPLTKKDIERMINSIKAKKLLDGVRGQAALDKAALIDCLGRLSQLLKDFPEIYELDINPLLVLPQGVKVLDARIIIK